MIKRSLLIPSEVELGLIFGLTQYSIHPNIKQSQISTEIRLSLTINDRGTLTALGGTIDIVRSTVYLNFLRNYFSAST